MRIITFLLSSLLSLNIFSLGLRDVSQVEFHNLGKGYSINNKPVKNFVSHINSEFSGVVLHIKDDKLIIQSPNKDFNFQSLGETKVEGSMTPPKDGISFPRNEIKYSRSYSHGYGGNNSDRINHVYEILFKKAGVKIRVVAKGPTSQVSHGGYDLFNTLDKCIYEYKKGIINSISLGFNISGDVSNLKCSND